MERERQIELLYLFLKGMMGALEPFSYLVLIFFTTVMFNKTVMKRCLINGQKIFSALFTNLGQSHKTFLP